MQQVGPFKTGHKGEPTEPTAEIQKREPVFPGERVAGGLCLSDLTQNLSFFILKARLDGNPDKADQKTR